MNQTHDDIGLLLLPLVLLAAAVVSVPIARTLRLSPIVAYLAAGVVIGPFGIGLIRDPQTILSVAQLGVVLLLFVIGLELEFARLLAMRRAIFGLGAAQLALTAAILAGIGVATGLAGWRGAIVAGLGLAMSATAIALKILEDRGDLQQSYGQRAFAILLFQDMSVVPLLALLPLLAPGGESHTGIADALMSVGKIAAAIAAVVVAGRWLLNPFLRLLAGTGAREVMTAAALLVVLGAAALMQTAGMSMALGAFLAGMLLAESNYRHELEADIEPFRGLLLALFFMGVGMSIDIAVVRDTWMFILAAAVAISALKMVVVWLLFLPICTTYRDALRAGAVLTAAGEFAFVLIPLGVALGALTATQGSLFAAIAAVTMLIATPVASLTDALLAWLARGRERAADEIDGVRGSILLVGFGRFGQIVAQCFVAEGVDVTAIDNDPEMVEAARRFGFKVNSTAPGSTLLRRRRRGGAHHRSVQRRPGYDAAHRRPRARQVRYQLPFAPTMPAFLRLIAKGVDFELRDTPIRARPAARFEALGLDPERARRSGPRSRDLVTPALQKEESARPASGCGAPAWCSPSRCRSRGARRSRSIPPPNEKRPPEGPAGARTRAREGTAVERRPI